MQVRIDDKVLQDIADKVREKNKETEAYKPSEIANAVDRILVTEPNIEMLEVTENGVYEAPEGVHGYSPIVVDVQPELEELEATENGEYNPTSYGFSKVTVDVRPELENITITDNGEYKSDKYGFDTVIVNCPPGLTAEELVVTGDCSYRFTKGGWDWFIDKYVDRIITKNITSPLYMFEGCKSIQNIPFQININEPYQFNYMFANCENLLELPNIRGTIRWIVSANFSYMFERCRKIRNMDNVFLPEMLDGFSTIKATGAYSSIACPNFRDNYSLRTIPSWWYKFKLCEDSTTFPASSYTLYNYMLNGCYTLDEAINIPVWRCKAAQTSNMLGDMISNCYRLKDFTFETNPDGTAIEAQWKSQVINLSSNVGYIQSNNYRSYITGYNSGITQDKEVVTGEDYQRLKNDPDWYCNANNTTPYYSRYDHDSAVRTINSLPDTSAYLATAGGTNTIKFKGYSGLKTDAGAINTLTEAEIAVATAKGWTVTLS